MKWFLLFFSISSLIGILSSCSSFRSGPFAASKGEDFFSYNCKIVNKSGKLIRLFKGDVCDYFNDGHVIVASQKNLSLVSPSGGVLWTKNINCHHMVRGTDIDQFIVLNSSFNTWDRTFLRFDRVSIFNLKGDEINYFDFFESRDQLLPLIKNSLKYLDRATYKTLQQPGDFLNVERSEKFRPVFYEFSHANSVYKISANRLSKKNPAFAEGNYIVNAAGINLVFILDKNLKKVLWSLESVSDFIHDVQVTPEGELLYFNNTFDSSYSSIELLDPISLRRTILFNGNAENKFRAESQGSVQRLPNGNYLVSKFDPRESQVLVIGEKGQIIATRYPKSMGSTGYNLDGLQEVKKLDLELFLKNNKPLF